MCNNACIVMQQKRYHIIIDVSGVENNILNDSEGLIRFLNVLPGTIGMHVLKGPEVAVGIAENPGLSGFVIIDFSHISVHTFTAYNEALVDIFSCRPFERDHVISAVLDYFRIPKSQTRIKDVWWG